MKIKASDFLIGRGELYVSVGGGRFCEIVYVSRGRSRSVTIANHNPSTNQRGSISIYFSLSRFLREWRPATVVDFQIRLTHRRTGSTRIVKRLAASGALR